MPGPWEDYQQKISDRPPWEDYGPPAGISTTDVVRSVGRGVPIIGGLLDKANAATYAALSPAYETIAPETAKADSTVSHAPSFSERYSENLKREQAKDTKYEKEHPTANLVGELAGGIGSTGAAAGTAVGARLLGLTGQTLPQLVTRGAASGAGISAADALTRGQDPMAAAGVGAGIGAAAPVAGRIVSTVAQPALNALRGIADPAGEAARRVAMAVERDRRAGSAGMTQPEFTAAQAGGAPVNIMDMGGETTRALARSAANTSPEGRAVLNRAIDDRFESQSGRLTDWLNSTFHYPDVPAQQAALTNVAKTANRDAYRTAHSAADAAHPNGVWSPELERLTSSPDVVDAMRASTQRGAGRAVAEGYGGFNPGVTFDNGILQFRRGPTGLPNYPDLRFWDYSYRNLRDTADQAFRAGRNSEGNALRTQANALRDELDRLVPSFQQARAGAARFFGAQDALEAGQNFVNSRLGNREARQALAQMSPQERQLFQDGFVDRYVQTIRATPDRRSVLNRLATSPMEREKLEIALGPQRARELESMLRVEGVMDTARGAVQGNSTTARQLAELGLAGGAYTLGTGGNILNPDPTAVMNAALVYGAARGRNAIDHRVSRQVANLLTSHDPQHLANGIRLLSRNPSMFGAIRNTDAALASIAARGAQPALLQ